jgi:hypothetical protein
MFDDWIYSSPPWLSSGVFVLVGVVASGLVLVALTRLVSAETRHAHNEFTLFTVTNMAVLYTVLLAFIAIVAWEDLSKASDIVGTEAGRVQDLYVDAQGLSDKGVTKELQKKLRQYVDAVVNTEWPVQQAGISRAATPALRDFRATLASVEPKTQGDAIVMQEMWRALNELYSAARSRRDAAGGHIPSSIWGVIFILGALIVGFTALLGMRSLWVHFLMVAGFTTAIVIVVALIVQLDFPFRGEISVSAEPFEHALSEVVAGGGATAPAGAAREDKGGG